MTQTTAYLDVPDGRLAYVEAGDTAKPPVVLLHAGYVDRRMWARELAHLSRRAHVVAPDARAHGASSSPTRAFRQCDDVAALVRHLDRGPAVLIGVSMGAGAAVDTALEHPETVAGLVLSGAGTNEPSFTDPWALGLLARLQAAVEARDPAAWMAAELEFAAGPHRALGDLDADVVALLTTMHEHFVSTHVRPGVMPPDVVRGSWERLSEITVPTLGIVGELDGTDHIAMCERAIAGVRDGRGVTRVAGAGHFPNLERPQEWEAAVDRHLDALLA